MDSGTQKFDALAAVASFVIYAALGYAAGLIAPVWAPAALGQCGSRVAAAMPCLSFFLAFLLSPFAVRLVSAVNCALPATFGCIVAGSGAILAMWLPNIGMFALGAGSCLAGVAVAPLISKSIPARFAGITGMVVGSFCTMARAFPAIAVGCSAAWLRGIPSPEQVMRPLFTVGCLFAAAAAILLVRGSFGVGYPSGADAMAAKPAPDGERPPFASVLAAFCTAGVEMAIPFVLFVELVTLVPSDPGLVFVPLDRAVTKSVFDLPRATFAYGAGFCVATYWMFSILGRLLVGLLAKKLAPARTLVLCSGAVACLALASGAVGFAGGSFKFPLFTGGSFMVTYVPTWAALLVIAGAFVAPMWGCVAQVAMPGGKGGRRTACWLTSAAVGGGLVTLAAAASGGMAAVSTVAIVAAFVSFLSVPAAFAKGEKAAE